MSKQIKLKRDGDQMDSSGSSKPKWYRQSFCKSWLEDSEFKGWLIQSIDGQPMCKVCDVKLKDPNKGALLRHRSSEKHTKAVDSKKQSMTMDSFLKPKVEDPALKLDAMSAKAELLMAGFMAEHNTPFLQATHMSELFKAMFPDSDIAKNMSIKKTKASYVMQDGIAYSEKQSIAAICRDRPISILIDESTDISMTQVLAVVVRYMDNNRVQDSLLDNVEVEDGSSDTLYKAVTSLLKKNNIPLENVVGFAADNCATMMGKHSGFQARLKKELPNIFVMGCVCHSFALCASHASQKLPSWLESFLKDVTCYFSRSPKRQREFESIQAVVKSNDHKILKLAQTRWLSRGQVVARIVEQWEALKLFFQSQMSVDKIDGAANIYKTMTTPGTKHMLLFLNYILPKIDKMNLHFQSEQPRIHTLFTNISFLFKELLSMFVKDDILLSCELTDIDPADATTHRPITQLNVGGRCIVELAKTSLGANEVKFRDDCRKFLIELCQQISARFDFSKSSLLASLSVLDPQIALSPSRPTSLGTLAMQFPQIVSEEQLDNLDDEWTALLSNKDLLAPIQDKNTPGEFWSFINMIKDGLGESKFPTLGRLMTTLAVLPHSSACVERIFSAVNLVKTPLTNRLHASTVANRLLAKQYLARNGQKCFSWCPDKQLVDDVKSGLCYRRYVERTQQTDSELVVFYDTENKEEFQEDGSN